MKNIVAKATLTLSSLSLFAGSALAQAGNPGFGKDADNLLAPGKAPLGESITRLINYFLGILGLIAVAFLIYAGVLMVTAAGNDEKITKAKSIITYSVIGIIIIILSWSIVKFVTGSLN